MVVNVKLFVAAACMAMASELNASGGYWVLAIAEFALCVLMLERATDDRR